ncbi:kelch repeat-containing protein [Bacteroidota bacterium]
MVLNRLAILLVTGSMWLACGIDTAGAQESSWSHREDFASPPRVETVGFSIGDKGYIATGTDGMSDHLLKDLQEYDPETNRWTFKSSLPFPLRGAAAFSIGKKAYITTGIGPTGLNYQMLEWDQGSNLWRARKAFPTSLGRMSAVGITIGNRGFIGTGSDRTGKALNDLWEYNPNSDTWLQKASLPGSGRSYATAFVIHDKVYIGLGSNGSIYLKDWWEYNPGTNRWKRMEDMAGGVRVGAMGFSVKGKGYIVGGVGYNMKPLRDIWEFDPIQNTWTQLDRFPGSSRGYGVGFNIGNNGYIAAGTSVEGYLFDLWECFPGTMVRASIPKEDNSINPVVISPNPFFYRFFMKIRHPYTGLLELTITNMRGQVVFRKSVNKEAEYIVRCYEIDYLPDGLFVFRVKDPSGILDSRQTVIHKSFDI